MENKREFHFNIFSFFIAFFIGIFYVYISAPKPKIIIKYPTPYNAEKIVYQSGSGDCFKFKVNEVNCEGETFPQPIVKILYIYFF